MFAAHVWFMPAATAPQPAGNEGRVGTVRNAVVPSPICPELLSPQHHSVKSVRIAHVWFAPAETLAQFVSEPIWVGDNLRARVPSPSCPTLFLPQHHSVPSSRIAHVC